MGKTSRSSRTFLRSSLWGLGMIASILALYVLSCALARSPLFVVKQVELEASGRPGPDEIRSMSGIRPGMNMLSLDTEDGLPPIGDPSLDSACHGGEAASRPGPDQGPGEKAGGARRCPGLPLLHGCRGQDPGQSRTGCATRFPDDHRTRAGCGGRSSLRGWKGSPAGPLASSRVAGHPCAGECV